MYELAAYAEHHFQAEVAGWAHANENGIYKLAPLCKQIVSGAEVNNFPDDILNNVKYDISDMIVQWHSHVFMSCSPSQPDKDTIKEALGLFPAIISIIINCKNEYKARLDIGKIKIASGYISIPQTTFDVELVPYYDNPSVSKEVKAKLSKPKPLPVAISTPVHHFPSGDRYGLDFPAYGSEAYGDYILPADTISTKAYNEIRDSLNSISKVDESLAFTQYHDGMRFNIFAEHAKTKTILMVDDEGLTIDGVQYNAQGYNSTFLPKIGKDTAEFRISYIHIPMKRL